MKNKTIKELIDMAQPDDICSECEMSEDGICEEHRTT